LQPFFVGVSDTGYKIDELGCLNELRGELQVHNLEEVKDKRRS
jgi:hypothetical protein